MERARNSDELRAEIDKFARQSGFEHFAYVLTISAPSLRLQHHVINGFPLAWHERYLAREYFKIDPVVHYAQNSSLPAIWSEEKFHKRRVPRVLGEKKSVFRWACEPA